MIDTEYKQLSISRQCALLSVSRGGFYYVPTPESAENLHIMELMDKQHLQHPYWGVERMCAWLNLDADLGFAVNQKRVRRLMRMMNIRAACPGPNTSKPGKGHEIYPYLLRNISIEKPDQVWATDITYIPMPKGFMYLMAIIDLYSRMVLGWDISNTMEAQWCGEVLRQTLETRGKPEIFNTDQGSQFTSPKFLCWLKEKEIKISMDGKGRATDNAFIERLWRTVKYEHIYLYCYPDGSSLRKGLDGWFRYYNEERRHSALNWTKPINIYHNKPNN
jgi:putative transposase